LDEQSNDPAGRSFAQAQLALYTAPSDVIRADSRLSHSREDNPFVESAICFLASTADAEGGQPRLMRHIQIFR
jgi:hypothetical protein